MKKQNKEIIEQLIIVVLLLVLGFQIGSEYAKQKYSHVDFNFERVWNEVNEYGIMFEFSGMNETERLLYNSIPDSDGNYAPFTFVTQSIDKYNETYFSTFQSYVVEPKIKNKIIKINAICYQNKITK